MKRFTKSTTFDVNYLFTDSREPSKKNYNKKRKFDNEAMFDVKVESVNVMNIKPKTKRVGRYEGKTNRRRKAIVKLAEGSTINYFGEE